MPKHRHVFHPGFVRCAEGHLPSVVAMIEGGKPCLDTARLLGAVQKAVPPSKRTLIDDHLDHSLEGNIGTLSPDQIGSVHVFKEIAKDL
jgi:DNA-binding FrmR family transcriptional regulator